MYKYDLKVIKPLSMNTRAPKLPNQNTVIIGYDGLIGHFYQY